MCRIKGIDFVLNLIRNEFPQTGPSCLISNVCVPFSAYNRQELPMMSCFGPVFLPGCHEVIGSVCIGCTEGSRPCAPTELPLFRHSVFLVLRCTGVWSMCTCAIILRVVKFRFGVHSQPCMCFHHYCRLYRMVL